MKELRITKDTILRSTINDYFENASANRPHEPLSLGVPPHYLKVTFLANLPSSNFKIGKSNTPTSQVLQPIVHMNVHPYL